MNIHTERMIEHWLNQDVLIRSVADLYDMARAAEFEALEERYARPTAQQIENLDSLLCEVDWPAAFAAIQSDPYYALCVAPLCGGAA